MKKFAMLLLCILLVGCGEIPAEETGELRCTVSVSVSCETVLDNMELLSEEKHALIPDGGVLLAPTEVTFSEGESVFNVLSRVCRQNKLHMEFIETPAYGSAYIEGIGNLYEFDVGSLSGWMYAVNGEFPNYGSSAYTLSDGDTVEWLYSCDLGADIGGADAWKNGWEGK